MRIDDSTPTAREKCHNCKFWHPQKPSSKTGNCTLQGFTTHHSHSCLNWKQSPAERRRRARAAYAALNDRRQLTLFDDPTT